MRMKTRPCSKRGQSRAMIKSRAPPPPIQESHSQMKPQHWGRAAEIPIGGAQGKVKLCQNSYIVKFCYIVRVSHCIVTFWLIFWPYSVLGNLFTQILIRAPGINIWDSSSPLQKTALDCCGQKKPLIWCLAAEPSVEPWQPLAMERVQKCAQGSFSVWTHANKNEYTTNIIMPKCTQE